MPESPSEDRPGDVDMQHWSRILRSTGSPLKLFALAVLICTTVFACAASVLGDPLTFMYCIHMFLGIVGVFSMIAVWCPRSLYHPDELKDIPERLLPKSNRIGPTLFTLVVIAMYAAYQYSTPARPLLIPEKFTTYSETTRP